MIGTKNTDIFQITPILKVPCSLIPEVVLLLIFVILSIDAINQSSKHEEDLRIVLENFGGKCTDENTKFDFPVDLDKYPRVMNIRHYEANVEAGDCIYIPQMWWHQVYSRLDLILCNMFYIYLSMTTFDI